MNPSTLRGLLGAVLVPNVRGLGPATVRFTVLGLGIHDVRVQSTGGLRSSIAIDDLDAILTRGELIVTTGEKTK